MASYVYGNVVRKEPTAERLAKQQKTADRQNNSRRKVMHMNRNYVAFLAVATIVAAFACVMYLSLQAEISERSSYITSLQQDIVDAKEANTTKYNAIMNSMNLEEIRNIAINEFGMINATPEQIIMYKSPTGSMITKYADIPESGILVSSDVMN